MITRRLGRTSLELSVIGFGAWAIGGGGWKFGWGSQDDRESIAAIHAALDLGVNWIDTARVYGLGRSERVVARALDDSDHQPLLLTKCTRVWDDTGEITGSMDPDSIRRELEASVAALGGRTIDLYLLHQPKPPEDIERGWETLTELRSQGLVRHIGVSNFDVAQLERCQTIGAIDVIEPRYSLLDRAVEEEILPYCAEREIGVLAYSPMASGLLTGHMSPQRVTDMDDDDWRRRHPDFQEPALSRNLRQAKRLREVGDRLGVSPGAAACAWVLGDERITSAIVGLRSAQQTRELLGDRFPLDDAAFAGIRTSLAEIETQ